MLCRVLFHILLFRCSGPWCVSLLTQDRPKGFYFRWFPIRSHSLSRHSLFLSRVFIYFHPPVTVPHFLKVFYTQISSLLFTLVWISMNTAIHTSFIHCQPSPLSLLNSRYLSNLFYLNFLSLLFPDIQISNHTSISILKGTNLQELRSLLVTIVTIFISKPHFHFFLRFLSADVQFSIHTYKNSSDRTHSHELNSLSSSSSITIFISKSHFSPTTLNMTSWLFPTTRRSECDNPFKTSLFPSISW